MNEITHIQLDALPVEKYPETVRPLIVSAPPAPATPGKRHNLTLINKLLAGYGMAIDDKMETVKIKSFRRYLAGAWKGKK